MYQAKNVVQSAAEVKAIMGEIYPTGVNEVIAHIDVHCRTWNERTPFIVISTASAAAAIDASPKGDPAMKPTFSTDMNRWVLVWLQSARPLSN